MIPSRYAQASPTGLCWHKWKVQRQHCEGESPPRPGPVSDPGHTETTKRAGSLLCKSPACCKPQEPLLGQLQSLIPARSSAKLEQLKQCWHVRGKTLEVVSMCQQKTAFVLGVNELLAEHMADHSHISVGIMFPHPIVTTTWLIPASTCCLVYNPPSLKAKTSSITLLQKAARTHL